MGAVLGPRPGRATVCGRVSVGIPRELPGLSFPVSGVVVRGFRGDASEVSEIIRDMVESC